MTRPLTWLCLFVALGSGLFLYQAKHRAQLLDREITQVMKTADATRARSGVLQVEYQLLSDPQRLAELTASHLSLRPTAPGQFSTWADLVRRLPPVGLTTPNDDPAEIAMASADDLPLPPIPPGVPPMALAQMAPAPAAPSLPRFAAPAPVAPAPVAQAPVALALAARAAPTRPPAPIRTATLPSPVVTPMVSPVLASAGRSYATNQGGTSYSGGYSYNSGGGQAVGSSLGMARSYQLPSALGVANAATFYNGNQ